MISCFDNVFSPTVKKEIDIYEYIEQIKRPEQSILEMIDKARQFHGKSKSNYKYIKDNLPCFTLNFSFNKRKTNTNIKAPTGFIYLDLDNETDIDLTNELIFVSWKSLSNTGRGILVKANGLTITNFKSTYLSIAKELNIKADKNASKPTQYCIHSYDKDIYVNDNSITWECKEDIFNNPPISSISLNRKRKDSTAVGENRLRLDNITDYDFKGKDYIFFEDEKEMIAKVYISERIEKGSRNNIFSIITHQIKSLNMLLPFEDFNRFMKYVNAKSCKPPLKEDEVNRIINKTFYKENILPILNEERRFIFNPKSRLSSKEKRSIYAPLLGIMKSKRTLKEIETTLLNWSIKTQGKVTINSLIKATGKCKNTIEKYYPQFKELRTKINNDLKLLAS